MEQIAMLCKKQIAITVLSILLGFLVAALILAFTGYDPSQAFSILAKGIFSKPKYMVNVVVKATPIILTGLSVVLAFKTGMFNIGAEGEYIVGTIGATVIGISCSLPPVLEFPLILAGGMGAGAIYGWLIGFLKAKLGIHEVITGIMLNWIAFYGSNFVVTLKYFHQPDSSSTYQIHQSGMDLVYRMKMAPGGMAMMKSHPLLMETVGKTDLNMGILIAILAAALIWLMLKKTTKGFAFRAVGLNKDAAECSGINGKKNLIHAMAISGAIAGLAGALMITGVSHKLMTLATTENYGFNGLFVAMLAGNSPIGAIFAGLLFAALFYGGGSIQSTLGAPSEIINIMVGTIVFFVAMGNLFPMAAQKLARKVENHGK